MLVDFSPIYPVFALLSQARASRHQLDDQVHNQETAVLVPSVADRQASRREARCS